MYAYGVTTTWCSATSIWHSVPKAVAWTPICCTVLTSTVKKRRISMTLPLALYIGIYWSNAVYIPRPVVT